MGRERSESPPPCAQQLDAAGCRDGSSCKARPSEGGGVAELRRTTERGSNAADGPVSAAGYPTCSWRKQSVEVLVQELPTHIVRLAQETFPPHAEPLRHARAALVADRAAYDDPMQPDGPERKPEHGARRRVTYPRPRPPTRSNSRAPQSDRTIRRSAGRSCRRSRPRRRSRGRGSADGDALRWRRR